MTTSKELGRNPLQLGRQRLVGVAFPEKPVRVEGGQVQKLCRGPADRNHRTVSHPAGANGGAPPAGIAAGKFLGTGTRTVCGSAAASWSALLNGGSTVNRGAVRVRASVPMWGMVAYGGPIGLASTTTRTKSGRSPASTCSATSPDPAVLAPTESHP